MSYEDLAQHDLFLPEEHWGTVDLGSSVNPWLLALVGALGLAACVLIPLGGGHGLTWVGAGLFVAFLYAFAIVACRGVDRQNRHIEELTAARASGRGRGGSGTPGSSTASRQ